MIYGERGADAICGTGVTYIGGDGYDWAYGTPACGCPELLPRGFRSIVGRSWVRGKVISKCGLSHDERTRVIKDFMDKLNGDDK